MKATRARPKSITLILDACWFANIVDKLEELHSNLKTAEDRAGSARSAWEKHMEKIEWDMDKAKKQAGFVDKMNSLWQQVEVENEHYNQAHKEIKNFLIGNK